MDQILWWKSVTHSLMKIMQYEATIDDPDVFSRPWKIKIPLYRRMEDGARLLEYKCVEFGEDLLYDHLRKGYDGPEGFRWSLLGNI